MKKQISIIVALAAITFGAMAQKPCGERCDSHQACTQVDTTKCHKAKSQRQLSETCQFKDLNLTDAQKAQINALNPRENCERIKKENKDCKKALGENCANKMRENRKEYLAKIKNILTPEQYTQFLENNFVNKVGKFDRKVKGDIKKMDGRVAKDEKCLKEKCHKNENKDCKKDCKNKKANKDKKDKKDKK